MPKALLVFTKKRNHFVVNIQNMEKLSVQQIQELQSFVKFRNGIFDFEKYEFTINKRIEFYEFESLLKHAQIDAKCSEHIIYAQTQPRVGFGQYKGMQYNELTDSYMLWLKTNYRGKDRETIDKELKKRKL